jgi:multicomponent Na+:H+ antiporter subunit B
MISKYRSLVVSLACRTMAPFIFLFGLYVIMAGVILLRMSLGREATIKKFPPQLSLILGAIGLLIYAGTGLTALLCGGNYLDYSYLPLPGVSSEERRYYGILFVEIGVALGVFGVLLSIFDTLTKEE